MVKLPRLVNTLHRGKTGMNTHDNGVVGWIVLESHRDSCNLGSQGPPSQEDDLNQYNTIQYPLRDGSSCQSQHIKS